MSFANKMLDLVSSDEHPAYETALLDAYGEEVETTPTGQPTCKMVAERVPPAGMNYATVEKRREKGRVVEVVTCVVLGTMAAIQAVLAESKASRRINTSFVERQNATDRHHDGRKARKTYSFSKDWTVREAMTYFTMYSYNSCWPVRTLREPIGEGRWRQRTPAMAAGLADYVWTMREWIRIPGVQRR